MLSHQREGFDIHVDIFHVNLLLSISLVDCSWLGV